MEKIPDILLLKKELIEYLNSIGVSFPSNNRFDQNFKEIKEDLEKDTTGKRDFSKEAHFRHAIAELMELKFILSRIKNLNIPENILQEKFKRIISGERPVDKKGNKINDDSRNTIFELILTSFLCEKGMSVEYENGSDIFLKFNGKNIGIECKRINGNPDKTLKYLLKDAYHQLLKNKDGMDFGIIAINIDNFYFRNGELVFSTHDQLIPKNFYQMIKNFIDGFCGVWQKRNIVKSPEFVPSVLVCLRGTVYSFDINLTGNAFFALLNNTSNPPYPNFEYVEKLSATLH